MSITILRPGTRILTVGSRGVRISQPVGGMAGNGLLNNLIAYWPGNEASGNALDLHTNALHLTDTNTVTSNPGLVYAMARQYAAANSEYHARLGDDALLSVGDTDFTIAHWVYMDTIAGMYISSKRSGVPFGDEYATLYSTASNGFRFLVYDGTNIVGTIIASTFGVPLAATWYLVLAWHNSVANTVSVQISNGTVDSAATTGVPGNTTTPFRIGCIGVGSITFNGRIGPTMFWKSAAGAGGVLSSAQRNALYNGGLGLPYASFTA